MNTLPFRPNVCLLIYRADKKLFLGQRLGEADVWQLPQGGIEKGFTAEEAALAEAHEELGADKKLFVIRQKLRATNQYDFKVPPDYALGKWRGQRQVFFILEFLGAESDILLNRFKPEFSNYAWCTVAEVKDRAEKQRLAGYLPALEEFEGYILSDN